MQLILMSVNHSENTKLSFFMTSEISFCDRTPNVQAISKLSLFQIHFLTNITITDNTVIATPPLYSIWIGWIGPGPPHPDWGGLHI